MNLHAMSAQKVINSVMHNDVWACVLMSYQPSYLMSTDSSTVTTPPEIAQLLDKYKDVFQDPKKLPPPMAYDHAISLLPGSVPINSRPYHYSPQHKSEIEQQV